MGKIYTKHGDDGTTALLGGERVPKTDVRVEANGAIDEVVALLGLVRAHRLETDCARNLLEAIQQQLMRLMAHVAASGETPLTGMGPILAQMETAIDMQTGGRKFSFVVPGADVAEAWLHVVRTKARTAERRLWAVHAVYPLSAVAMQFMNRLSDYLFVLAESGQSE